MTFPKLVMDSALVLKAIDSGDVEGLTRFIDTYGYTRISECKRQEVLEDSFLKVSNYLNSNSYPPAPTLPFVTVTFFVPLRPKRLQQNGRGPHQWGPI